MPAEPPRSHDTPDRTDAYESHPTSVGDRTTDAVTAVQEVVRPLTDLPDIPGYEVTGEIARGGMGRVLAARELALDRDVAVKVLLPGAKAGRFVTESKITARLPHPNIPPVHALGTLPDGSPYLAMKLVRGRTLAAELKARAEPSAGLPRWVQAFEGVCQAVGFAHARGVIHRDLKPANVMVGEFGEVQVMDWGLAKELVSREAESAEPSAGDLWDAVEAEGQDGEDRTRAGAVMGTPAYMAPEQARGEPVEARADVFALGGVLTAVLTGRPVFAGKSTAEVIRRAAAGDTADALARLAACGADAELVAVARDCLAVEAASRPADGRAVAERVAAYRAGVEGRLRQAESDRAAAEARAVEGRKRRRLATVAAAVLAVAAGLAGWQAVRAWVASGEARTEAANARAAETLAEERATAEAAANATAQTAKALADKKARDSEASNGFLVSVLMQGSAEGQATKERKADPNLTLRSALDYAAKNIDGRFADQPEIEARLRNTIGRAFVGVAAYGEGERHLSTAVRLREMCLGTAHPDTLTSVSNLATLLHSTGDLTRAEPLHRRVLAGIETLRGSTHADTLASVSNLAYVLKAKGDITAAEPLYQRALTGRELCLGSDHPDTLTSASNLATLLVAKGDVTRAEPLFQRAMTGRERVLGSYHPDTLNCINNLGFLLKVKGDLDGCELLYRRALTGFESTLGPNHPDTLISVVNLAAVLDAKGDLVGAEQLFRRALSGSEASLGSEHSITLASISNLASLLDVKGDQAEAERLYRRALAGREKAFGPDHPDTLRSVNNLGYFLSDMGNSAAAEPLYRRAAEGVERRQFRLVNAINYVNNYIRCLQTLGRYPEADSWRRKWLAVVVERDGPESAAAAAERVNLAVSLLSQRAWAEAEAEFRQAMTARQKRAADPKPTVAPWQVASTRSLLGEALLGQQKFADAEPLLQAGYDGLMADAKAIPPAAKSNVPQAVDRLIRLARAQKKPAELARWQAERAKYPPEVAPRPRPGR